MLGGRNFLLISDPEDFKQAGDEDVEALRAYLERPSPFSTVVFLATEPDRRRRFVTLLEKKAQLVELRSPDRREAADWVEHFLQQAGVEIARGLAKISPGSLKSVRIRAPRPTLGRQPALDAHGAGKIADGPPGPEASEPADLEVIVAFREEREIGKLLRAIGERKCAAALATLRELLASKVAETLILWCIGDLFRQAMRGVPSFGNRGGWSRARTLIRRRKLHP